MTSKSTLKKEITSVLNRFKSDIENYKIVYLDRITEKIKEIPANEFIIKKNNFSGFSNQEFIPFNKIKEIKSKTQTIWKIDSLDKKEIKENMIDKLEQGTGFAAVFDYFKDKERYLGLILIQKNKDKFWVSVEGCSENNPNDDNLFIRDDTKEFKTAEEAVSYAINQNKEISIFDFFESGNMFMHDITKVK